MRGNGKSADDYAIRLGNADRNADPPPRRYARRKRWRALETLYGDRRSSLDRIIEDRERTGDSEPAI